MTRISLVIVLMLVVAVFGMAYSGAKASGVCRGQAGEIVVCVNGKRLVFDAAHPPHRHEAGSIYAPVAPLAERLKLDIRTVIRADGRSAIVTVNGRPFAPAMASGAQGIHVHDGQVYVPLRELAAAVGIPLDMDAEAGVAGFAR